MGNQLVGIFTDNKEILVGSKVLMGTDKSVQKIVESKVLKGGWYWQDRGETLAPADHKKIQSEVDGDVIAQVTDPSGDNILYYLKQIK